jgi:hypothetical protein
MGKFIWLAQMDIPPEHDALFNHLYNYEHFPAFRKVQGVVDCERYELVEAKKGEFLPKYAAIYHLDSADVITKPEWQAAADSGQWKQKIRPHTFNRVHGLFRKIK